MSNNQPYNEKLLKIFTGIRCLNRDQLPRYLEGRQTELEKHLVEQHLVDCDLCHDALQALKNEQLKEQYPAMAGNIQQYIRDSIRSVSQSQRKEDFIRREKKKESFLIYFWILAFVVLGVSAVYLSQGYKRNKPVYRPTVAAVQTPAATPVNLPETSNNVDEAAVTDHKDAIPALSKAAVTAPAKAAAPPSVPAVPPTVPAAKKDTAKAKVLSSKEVRKPTDSPAGRTAAERTKTADSLKRVAEKAATEKAAADKAAADKAAAEKEKARLAAAKEKEKEKDDAPKAEKEKPATKNEERNPSEPANTDEYLYKAAMVYQQQGDLGEAMSRYKRLASTSTGRYGELAQYQLGVCYRSKGQMGRARRAFKEVIRMNGNMKDAAQKALDNL